VMSGQTLAQAGLTEEPAMSAVFVKAPVFPFRRFPGVDPVLGPEMKSTGEVMGIGESFGVAFAKAWIGAGQRLLTHGTAFLSVHDRDKAALVPVAERLRGLGWRLVATAGTGAFLRARGLEVETVRKVQEGRPHIVDAMINRTIDLVINTPLGRESQEDDAMIRRTALRYDIPCVTTLPGAMAAAEAIAALGSGRLDVASLQQLHQALAVRT